MEDVLELYEEEYDPRYPTVCFDEKLVAPHANVRPPQPPAAGHAERINYDYERLGTAHLFFLVEPLAGWRHVEMTERRTRRDDAEPIRWLVDPLSPEAEYVRIVQDNLNTHTKASLDDVFPPEEARRILRRVEFHSPPKHASWLMRAEIEISIFQRACLSRRVESMDQLRTLINKVELARNRQHCTISWQFPTNDARDKLPHVYPDITTGAA
ncbi:MAG TPA: transposase [Ktedonobacteraceae bacterium]|nr:transposase [Ktedonobacteraceae bacterium]